LSTIGAGLSLLAGKLVAHSKIMKHKAMKVVRVIAMLAHGACPLPAIAIATMVG